MDHPTTINPLAWKDHFALVDCTSFYASCEKLFKPDLHDRPLIVLSNNDGCVVARSKEAKQLGIPTGVPLFKIEALVKEHNIAVYSSNYELYGDISRRIMETLRHFSPCMEIYSIDEAFLKLPTTGISVQSWAQAVNKQVKRWTGIDVTVGIGPSKTLAKVSSHLAKKESRHKGVFCLTSPDQTRAILSELPVCELWGIGRRYQSKLSEFKIEKVQQLIDLGETWMGKHLGGIVGRRLWWELQGLPCHSMVQMTADRQQIVCSRSFSNPIDRCRDLEDALCLYTTDAAARLRNYNLAAQKLTVFLHTNLHKKNNIQHHPVQHHHFAQATFFTPDLIEAAKSLLRTMYQPGAQYNKVGVILWDLCLRNDIEKNLFLPANTRQEALMKAIDYVNGVMGKNILKPASFPRTGSWQMRREKMSKRYTSRWPELPVISRCMAFNSD